MVRSCLIAILVSASIVSSSGQGCHGSIKGKVLNEEGSPLPQAVLAIVDTGLITVSDVDGNFLFRDL